MMVDLARTRESEDSGSLRKVESVEVASREVVGEFIFEQEVKHGKY